MHTLVTIFLHLLLISSVVIVQSQAPAWNGNYSIATTGSNPVCNQTACCCLTSFITLLVANPLIQLNSIIQGATCGTGNNALSASFILPPGYEGAFTNVGFSTTDVYILMLSSDSNTLTVNDTTNQQCSSVAQRISGVANSTDNTASTTPTSTMTMTMMNTTPSPNSDGRNMPGFSIAYCLFVSIIVFIMV